MTVPQQVAHFLQTHRPLPYCDSCIQSALKLKRHQQVQQATSGGAASGGFIRRAGTCSVFGKNSAITHAYNSFYSGPATWSLLHSHKQSEKSRAETASMIRVTMPAQGRGEAVGNLWADRPFPLDWPLRFRNDVVSESLSVTNYAERADDIVRAV